MMKLNIVAILGTFLILMPGFLSWQIDYEIDFESNGMGYSQVLGLAQSGTYKNIDTFELETFDQSKYMWLSDGEAILSDSIITIPDDVEPCLSFEDATNLTLDAYMNISESENLDKVEVWIKKGGLLLPINTNGEQIEICDSCEGNIDFYCIYKVKNLGSGTITVNPVIEIK